MRRLVLALTLLLLGTACVPAPALAGYEDFDIAAVDAELSTRQAGDHPDFTASIEMATDPSAGTDNTGHGKPYALTRDVRVSLPPGLVANPNAVSTCSAVQFVTALNGEGCPFSSQVGIGLIYAGLTPNVGIHVPIYNLEPSGGDTVARFGFYVSTVPAHIDAHVRSDGDYGVTAEIMGISSVSSFQAAEMTFWGVPGDPSHNTERLTVAESVSQFKTQSPPRPFGRAPEPFLTNPTSCGQQLEVGFEADSYQQPGAFRTASAPLGEVVGCPLLSFEPSFSLIPTSREAAAASGVDAILTIPQNENVNGLATSHLRDTVVRLAEGLTIAAGAADGLDVCSEAQVGYRVSPPPPARCPEASRIATAEIDSPSLSRPLRGAVYLRTPAPGRLTRVWLVADELGVRVKLPGEIRLEPGTGQMTSLFLETPQVPLRRVELHFKGGSRGVIATPISCGLYRTAYGFTPWSGAADAEGGTPMTFDRNCDTGGFAPKLMAGTVNPAAGRFSPFVTDLIRESGEQNVARLEVDLPPGVLAKLAGVGVCGEGEAVTGACPAASKVGTAAVATGPGPSPLWVPQPGRDPTAVYLAGPYRGGPYSLVVKVPAQAGPFDLGTVVARAAIHVDPETARVSVASDALPQFLEGIPVSYRDIHVDADRVGFTLNPTSCDPARVGGSATSALGATAALSSRFQVGGCAALGFKPKLRLKLDGGTGRGAHPALHATLTMPRGGANVARAQVALPRSQFLDQAHIGTVCTRVQFAAAECPAKSVYGRARAFTPLLDRPLTGPVYLRSSSNPLPDLVVDLRGPVHIVLRGRIDSVRGGIRTTFEALPDAAVEKFVLSMYGGGRGLLVNSRDLCSSSARATVRMDGQNGKLRDFRPLLRDDCRR